MNPYNTVFDAKRLIGRKFADEEVQADMKHWPYKIIDKAGKPVIQVEYKGEEKQFVSRPGLVLCSLPSVSLTLTYFPSPVDPRGNLFHGSRQDEGDCRGLPRR
jgi:hypothetical protein